MAYGVIIYENQHDILMDMTPEQVGNVVQNMIRAFRGEEHKHLDSENAYSLSMYQRVSEDKGKIPDKVIAGSKGGAPKGNKNAKKNKFTEGVVVQTYDFQQLEKKVVKN
jgi:hypothetical protein